MEGIKKTALQLLLRGPPPPAPGGEVRLPGAAGESPHNPGCGRGMAPAAKWRQRFVCPVSWGIFGWCFAVGFFQGSFRIVSFVCSFLFCLLNGALLSRNGKLHKTSFDDFLVSCSRGLALTYGQV